MMRQPRVVWERQDQSKIVVNMQDPLTYTHAMVVNATSPLILSYMPAILLLDPL